MGITIHSSQQDFAGMRIAGNLAARTLDYIAPYVKCGITTDELNTLCHDYIVSNKGTCAPLGYLGYPKSICTSVNNVVCHGIPGAYKLQNGDIINIDVTTIVNGWHGDTSRMFIIGDVSREILRLVDVCYNAMMLGIEQVKPGNRLGNIGHAIQSYVESNKFSVVQDYCGHGIGRIFHDDPQVLHYGKANTGLILQEGMFFTIEPMINAGRHHTVLDPGDGWTVTTRDKSLSAQFEHTLAVTASGYEIFTLSPAKLDKPY